MTDKVGCAQTEENYYALVTSGKGHAETINGRDSAHDFSLVHATPM